MGSKFAEKEIKNAVDLFYGGEMSQREACERLGYPSQPTLHRVHSGRYMIGRGGPSLFGSPDALAPPKEDAANLVVERLGSYSGGDLRELNHGERPW